MMGLKPDAVFFPRATTHSGNFQPLERGWPQIELPVARNGMSIFVGREWLSLRDLPAVRLEGIVPQPFQPYNFNAATPEVTPHVAPQVEAQVTAQVAQQDKCLKAGVLQILADMLGIPAAQVTAQVAAQVVLILDAITGSEKSREALQRAAGISHREHFRKAYMEPLLAAGWIERTIPDKPRSKNQRNRLTEKGRAVLSREGA